MEIKFSDWVVNQDYVICKETRASVVTKFASVSNNSHIDFAQSVRDGPSGYSEKEFQPNDTLLHFVEFSNVHNSDRSSNATRSKLVYKNV